ncbi:Hypothetical_protein [Hexamita inflata]|uniref:Hypothetical_protein n=1 Tax=Hexamita inflata TaxID=28002 RepID=A0AA86QDB4_9EUKA|nr:Hypothetical protein HINF_LOCUS38677 [Hexamita inflata]
MENDIEQMRIYINKRIKQMQQRNIYNDVYIKHIADQEQKLIDLIIERPLFKMYYNKSPDFNPNMTDDYFGTIAMLKLKYGLDIEKALRHDPNIVNSRGYLIKNICEQNKHHIRRWMVPNQFQCPDSQ